MITFDADGVAWIFWVAVGLVKFDGTDWVLCEFEGDAWTAAIDRENHVWAFIGDTGLSEFDGSEWTLYPMPDSLR